MPANYDSKLQGVWRTISWNVTECIKCVYDYYCPMETVFVKGYYRFISNLSDETWNYIVGHPCEEIRGAEFIHFLKYIL